VLSHSEIIHILVKVLTGVAELTDAHDSKSCGPKRRDGSTPFSGTNKTQERVVPGIKRVAQAAMPGFRF
jgi:hypothetical protein